MLIYVTIHRESQIQLKTAPVWWHHIIVGVANIWQSI